jgi:RimJ/RimL family protein N-acetyltransferase
MPELNEFGQPLGPRIDAWVVPTFPEKKIFYGHFCRIEPLDPTRHAEPLYQANRIDIDGRMWTYLPYGPFETLEDFRTFLESPLSGNPIAYVIVNVASGQPVGFATYLNIKPDQGVIEVGHLAYSPLLQGTTAATEAMALMMEYAFALGYRRYEWKADCLNASSCAAAERLGFRFEGIFRQDRIVKERNRDTAWYSVIDIEWPVIQGAYRAWLAPENFDSSGQQRTRLSDLIRNSRDKSAQFVV